MKRSVKYSTIISNCNDCPFYDECAYDKGVFIPDDCPLEDA